MTLGHQEVPVEQQKQFHGNKASFPLRLTIAVVVLFFGPRVFIKYLITCVISFCFFFYFFSFKNISELFMTLVDIFVLCKELSVFCLFQQEDWIVSVRKLVHPTIVVSKHQEEKEQND